MTEETDNYLAIEPEKNGFFTEANIKTIENSFKKYTVDDEPNFPDDNPSDEMQINAKRNEIIKAFSYFDKDKNGLINAAEFRELAIKYGGMSGEELDQLIERAEIDGNGFINYVELAYLFIK